MSLIGCTSRTWRDVRVNHAMRAKADMCIQRGANSPSVLSGATGMLFYGLRRPWHGRQHPGFPMAGLANVYSRPKARTLNRRSTLVLTRHAIFAHREGCVGSQWHSLMHLIFLLGKSRLEYGAVELLYIRSRPLRVNVHATACEQCSDPRTILSIEVLSVCRAVLFNLLLEVSVGFNCLNRTLHASLSTLKH